METLHQHLPLLNTQCCVLVPHSCKDGNITVCTPHCYSPVTAVQNCTADDTICLDEYTNFFLSLISTVLRVQTVCRCWTSRDLKHFRISKLLFDENSKGSRLELIRKLLWSPDTKPSTKIRTKRSGLTQLQVSSSSHLIEHFTFLTLPFILSLKLTWFRERENFIFLTKCKTRRIGWRGPKSKIVKFEVFDIFWQHLRLLSPILYWKLGWNTEGKMLNDSWIDCSNFLNSPPRRSFSHWLDVFVLIVLLDN